MQPKIIGKWVQSPYGLAAVKEESCLENICEEASWEDKIW